MKLQDQYNVSWSELLPEAHEGHFSSSGTSEHWAWMWNKTETESVQNHKNLKTGSELNPAALSSVEYDSVDSEVRKNLQCSGAQSHITQTAAGPLWTWENLREPERTPEGTRDRNRERFCWVQSPWAHLKFAETDKYIQHVLITLMI